ncbi:MAG: 16S rRNA (cytidine(1402)-2'-O)-methyltransferase [Polyangiaceae bacterium]
MLYVIATPIGNLEDLSRRAERTLREADRVAAEDTRRARGLLSHLGITGKPIDRLDAHASDRDVARLVEMLSEGQSIALVTDAGTPAVSDPGMQLVAKARAAGITIVPIPGPSAVVTAIAASGLVSGAFRFLGFLPRSGSERAEALATVASTPEAVIVFESPQRLNDTLSDLASRMPSRQAMVGRELTKLHEEFIVGSLAELAAEPREWQGEITLVLGSSVVEKEQAASGQIDLWIDEALAAGRSSREAADITAARSGRPRREIYARVIARKGRE